MSTVTGRYYPTAYMVKVSQSVLPYKAKAQLCLLKGASRSHLKAATHPTPTPFSSPLHTLGILISILFNP